MTIEQLVRDSRERLGDNGYVHAEREIDILLGHLMECDTAKLVSMYEQTADESVVEQLDELIERRINGEPIAYLIGTQNFMGYLLKTDNRALIPRPETEQLVEIVVRSVRDAKLSPERILEIGTGSGAIALMLKKHYPSSEVIATDVSDDALSLAEENAARLKLDVKFVESDLFAKVEGKFDLIVANLPYVPTQRLAFVSDQILDHEPMIAIDAGEDGLKYINPFLGQINNYLNEKGLIAIEMWHTHGEPVRELVQKHLSSKKVEVIKDLAGFDRFALIH